MKPVVGNTWATRGQTPIIFAKTNWEKLSVIGGITSTGQFLQQTHEGSIKATGFIAFLTHLLRHIKGKVTVVVDNGAIHKAKVVLNFVAQSERLSITYLPPYSPELNPIELVWAYVKRHHLANFCPATLEQLKAYFSGVAPMNSAGTASQTINLNLLVWGGFCPSLAFLRSPTSQKPRVSMLSSHLSAFSRTDHAYPTSPDQSGGSSEILAPGEVFSDYAGATPEYLRTVWPKIRYRQLPTTLLGIQADQTPT